MKSYMNILLKSSENLLIIRAEDMKLIVEVILKEDLVENSFCDIQKMFFQNLDEISKRFLYEDMEKIYNKKIFRTSSEHF